MSQNSLAVTVDAACELSLEEACKYELSFERRWRHNDGFRRIRHWKVSPRSRFQRFWSYGSNVP